VSPGARPGCAGGCRGDGARAAASPARPRASRAPRGSPRSRPRHHSAAGFAPLAVSSRVSISFHWTNCLERSSVWTGLLREKRWEQQGRSRGQSAQTARLQSPLRGRAPGRRKPARTRASQALSRGATPGTDSSPGGTSGAFCRQEQSFPIRCGFRTRLSAGILLRQAQGSKDTILL